MIERLCRMCGELLSEIDERLWRCGWCGACYAVEPGEAMKMTIHVTEVHLTSADGHDRATGLVGWLRFTINGRFKVDGATLRQTRGGRYQITYPARRDGHGGSHYYFKPLDDATRREIERQVFEALGIGVEA